MKERVFFSCAKRINVKKSLRLLLPTIDLGGTNMQYSDDFELEEKKPKSRVFPIVLAICLIAVCGVAVTAFVNSIAVEEPQPSTSATTTTTATTSKTVQQVVIPATDIPDDRTTTTTVPTTVPTTTEGKKDLFVFPVSNRILHHFSETHTFSETLGEWTTHNGADFEAEADSPVKAVADGEIIDIRQDLLWGDVIELRHEGNVVTRYCGATAVDVQKGQTVSAGDVIGKVASVPSEILKPAHLHLEMMVNGNYMDPLTMITGETVNVTESKEE